MCVYIYIYIFFYKNLCFGLLQVLVAARGIVTVSYRLFIVVRGVSCPRHVGSQQWPQDWKRSVFIPISKKGNAKGCSNYCTIALVSHASKVILKILQARLQQYMNQELPHVQAGFRKGRGTRGQIANIR